MALALAFRTGDAGNDGAHQIDIARWALGVDYPKTASGMGGKLFFDDDQQTPDTMNVTFDYGEKALIWEMRIWNPYGMDGQENGVAVYGSEATIQIGRWNRRWGYKLFDPKDNSSSTMTPMTSQTIICATSSSVSAHANCPTPTSPLATCRRCTAISPISLPVLAAMWRSIKSRSRPLTMTKPTST